jgi:hypothetical protein
MTALSAVEPRRAVHTRANVHIRVTDASAVTGLLGYLDRLGLRALAGFDGSIWIHPWDDVEWHEARVEIERCIDSWVRRHGVAVQLS